MRLLLLAALLAGCGGERPPPDPEVQAEAARCDARLLRLSGRQHVASRMHVLWTDDATKACNLGYRVAGCYRADLDYAAVERRPTVRETAFCHEATHRARWLSGRDLDNEHADRAWWSE